MVTSWCVINGVKLAYIGGSRMRLRNRLGGWYWRAFYVALTVGMLLALTAGTILAGSDWG